MSRKILYDLADLSEYYESNGSLRDVVRMEKRDMEKNIEKSEKEKKWMKDTNWNMLTVTIIVLFLLLLIAFLGISKVKAAGNVCQIGNQTYTTLSDAVTAVPTNNAQTTIEMLTAYTLPAAITVPTGKNIIIKPASTVSGNTILARSSGNNNYFIVNSGGTLTLRDITLNDAAGGLTSASAPAIQDSGTVSLTGSTIIENMIRSGNNNGMGVSLSGGVLNMEDNSAINGCTGYQGAAVYLTNASTFTMEGSSAITGCTGINAGVIDISGGSTATIQGNASVINNTGGSYGTSSAIFLRYSGPASVLNIRGSSKLSGNTSNGGSNEACTIASHHDAGTINIGESAVISSNVNTNGTGAAVLVASGVTLNLTGGTLTGNTSGAKGGGGIYVFKDRRLSTFPVMNISGNSKVYGNMAGSSNRNVYLDANTNNINVIGSLASDANIGVTATDRLAETNQFGVTISASASSVDGLYHFTNDTNASLYGVAGISNEVVWGKGTCQIIRNGVWIATYDTLAAACATAQSGDTIEVFKSHVSPAAVLASGKTGVTIKTAPTGTPTVSNSRTFLPASGESTTATVSRGTSDTTSTLLTVSGEATVSNLILDGKSVASNNPLISVSQGGTLTLEPTFIVRNGVGTTASGSVGTIGGIDVSGTLNSGATITGCQGKLAGAIACESTGKVNLTDGTNITGNSATLVNAAAYTPGAVFIKPQAGLTVKGSVIVQNNTNASGGAANVGLNDANGTIGVIDSLGQNSYIGVTVQTSNAKDHVSGHDFAVGYSADGQTPSSATATAAVGYFHDDISPNLAITANGTTAGDVTHESKIYFDDGHIIVTKTATGTYADKSKTFTMSVSYTAAGGTVVTRTCNIADGGSQTFSIPVGAAYTVTETAAAGYTGSVTATVPAGSTETSVKNGDGITVTGTKAVGNTTLAYTNSKIDIPVTGVATGSDSGAWMLISIGFGSTLLAMGTKWKHRPDKKIYRNDKNQ